MGKIRQVDYNLRGQIMNFDNKKICIWGYGREGKSSEEFLKRFASPACIDIYEGKREGIDESFYDLIIKSPGIVMEEDNPKYTSQTQIFLEKYRDQVIGITGTKGKSTTSSMLFSVLGKCSNRPVLLLGNIGQPCLDYFDSMTEDTIVVYEMSCHQLCHNTVSPHIGVFLNLFEEHLDYYKTVEKYFTAKSHVATYQTEGDFFYKGSNVPDIKTKAATHIIDPENISHYDLLINGEHNQFNAEFVYRIATERFNCDSSAVREAIAAFEGLSHRLQLVKTVNGLRFFDDSISTIPEAAISAALSIEDAKTLLIGGMDRGIDYSKLADFIREHAEFQYICMYESGKRIYGMDGVANLPYTYLVDDLSEAVKKAYDITAVGSVILSPAAASYGYFKNFEERGDVFQALINEY